MSKKFKGKTCVYCATLKSSQTGDHVFAKEFFLPNRRSNLPQVPACDRCNNKKSELEHYLTAILPFGGLHADAHTNLEKQVPPRLKKNLKLHRHLANANVHEWINQKGLLLPTIKLPIDSSKLYALFCYIVKGLMWHHWGTILTPNHVVRVGGLTREGENFFQSLFHGNASQRIRNDIGEGTFIYEGVQGIDDPHLSLWNFVAYGGLAVSDDPSMPSEISSRILGITGKREIISPLWDRLSS
jgi:hypothetical protein